jgi:hypothetical protein
MSPAAFILSIPLDRELIFAVGIHSDWRKTDER